MKDDDKANGERSETRLGKNPDSTSEARTTADGPDENKQGRTAAVLVVSTAMGWVMLKTMGKHLVKSLFGRAAPEAVEERATSGHDKHFSRKQKEASREQEQVFNGERKEVRDEDRENDVDLVRRAQWGTVFVWLAFAACMAGGVGFLLTYWSGGNNLLLGGSLALFLGALGAGLVLWAHWLTRHKQVTEPREELASTMQERVAAWKEFDSGAEEVHRRSLLKWFGVAAVGMFASMVISLIRSLSSSPDEALYTTVWKRGQRLMTDEGKPITVHSLEPGSTLTVFPENSIESEKSQTVLIRVKEELLQLPANRTNWAPMGYLAFSRVCTHAGCPVGLYQSETHLLLCPCHQSIFNVLRAAQPTGGPAARALPQLPLYIDSDGTLRAAGGFSEPPGPGFWGMP